MIKAIICGIGGRMGRAVYAEIENSQELELLCGVDAFASGDGVCAPVFKSFEQCPSGADVIIDFSRPDSLDGLLDYAVKNGSAAVIATTGYSDEQKQRIEEASKTVPIFQSFNMSLGLNLLVGFVKKASGFLYDFDIEIIEKHHNMKVDAPSGTALLLADAASEGARSEKRYVFGRCGRNAKRQKEEIGVHAVRGGTIVGEHDVMFIGNNECVTLSHSATSREIFAKGAVRAALFLCDKTDGKYDMQDVIRSEYAVNSVSSIHGQALLTFDKVSDEQICDLLEVLADANVNVDMINESGIDPLRKTFAVSVESGELEKAKSKLDEKGIAVNVRDGLTKTVIEGAGMSKERGVAAKVIRILSGKGINVRLISTGETEIYVLTDSDSDCNAADTIRTAFGI